MSYKKVLLKQISLARKWTKQHPESHKDLGGKGEQMYLRGLVDEELIENYKDLDRLEKQEESMDYLDVWVVSLIIYHEQKVAKFKKLPLRGDKGKNRRADYLEDKEKLLEVANVFGSEEMKGIYSIPLPPKEEAYEVLKKIRMAGYPDDIVRAASYLMGFTGKVERTKNIKERDAELNEVTDRIFDAIFGPKDS